MNGVCKTLGLYERGKGNQTCLFKKGKDSLVENHHDVYRAINTGNLKSMLTRFIFFKVVPQSLKGQFIMILFTH